MKEKIKKLVDAALLYHTEKDGLRVWAQSPFEQDGFVYATDGKTMIRIPSLFTDSDYEMTAAAPNVAGFFLRTGKLLERYLQRISLKLMGTTTMLEYMAKLLA